MTEYVLHHECGYLRGQFRVCTEPSTGFRPSARPNVYSGRYMCSGPRVGTGLPAQGAARSFTTVPQVRSVACRVTNKALLPTP